MTESERRYCSWGMTPRMARKKDRIVRAFVRAQGRGDRRRMSKWMHANTRFDVTRANGPWSYCWEARNGSPAPRTP